MLKKTLSYHVEVKVRQKCFCSVDENYGQYYCLWIEMSKMIIVIIITIFYWLSVEPLRRYKLEYRILKNTLSSFRSES